MENKHLENSRELLADNLEISKKQKKRVMLTRQEAIQSLLEETAQAEKVVNRFLKVLETKACHMASQAKTSMNSDNTYDKYHCIRIRLMMLQSLFMYMENTARQLFDKEII